MFDSHCHLHDDDVRSESGSLISRALRAGVRNFLLAGVDPAGWRKQVELMDQHAELVSAFGVHPQWIAEHDASAVTAACKELEGAVVLHPRCVAIGETGLDGSPRYRDSLELQEMAFRQHIRVARAASMPLVLHILDAHGRALSVLSEAGIGPAGGVIHSCSASAEVTKQYLELGLHISFAGSVGHPHAKRVHQAARSVPDDRLLVETDAPFQTPYALRPARNEPAFLVAIVEALATLRGQSATELGELTAKNARRLFGVENGGVTNHD